jgi:FeS assembly SUF system protein
MDAKSTGRLNLPLSGEKPMLPDTGAEPPVLPPGAPLEEQIVVVLHTCYDPEIPIDIYELGLIYDIQVSPERAVAIKMTLTSPACPVAGALPAEVQQKVAAIPGVASATVDLVWDPPWDKNRMSEAAQLQLGLFD